jgi:hypothetical protein
MSEWSDIEALLRKFDIPSFKSSTFMPKTPNLFRSRATRNGSPAKALSKIYRSPRSLHPRENDVFMLDGQPAVITVKTKTVTELAPPLRTVSDS